MIEMKTMKTEPTPKQLAKMAQILTAAISCFAQKGFHQTSTAEICKAAGMSPGNLFHYFPSKMAIIEAIAQEDGQLLEAIFTQQGHHQQPLEAIVQTVLAMMAYVNSSTEYAQISMEIAAEAVRNQEVRQVFLATEEANKQKLAQWVSAGIAEGTIDATLDPLMTAGWLLTLVDGTLGRKVLTPDFDWASEQIVVTKIIRKALAA